MDRKEPRFSANSEARIVFGSAKKISCTICNISQSGAMLLVESNDWLPSKFELVDTWGVRRQVALIWQAADRIGVRFTDQAPRRAPEFGRRKIEGVTARK